MNVVRLIGFRPHITGDVFGYYCFHHISFYVYIWKRWIDVAFADIDSPDSKY